MKRSSTVFIDDERKEKLKEISAKRKEDNNLCWSQQNIVADLIDKQHKKECK